LQLFPGGAADGGDGAAVKLPTSGLHRGRLLPTLVHKH
jgi:hypothetical protein